MILFGLLYENSSISYFSLYLSARVYCAIYTCKQLCEAHNKKALTRPFIILNKKHYSSKFPIQVDYAINIWILFALHQI